MNTLKNVLLGSSLLMAMMAWPIGAAAARQGASPKVEYYSHEQVAAAFAKGGTLTRGSSGHAIYRVMTGRRDRAGEVEVHRLDTDIFYVVKGTATFVTGGTVVGTKHTAPNEMRGQSIKGGTPHHLSPEDVIVIPHGVPHWFESVNPPFLYLVIKVR